MTDQMLILLIVLPPSLIVWSFILWQNRPRSGSQQPAWDGSSQWLKDEDRDWLKLQGVDVSLIPPNPEMVQQKLDKAREIQAGQQSVHVHADGFGEWSPPSKLLKVRTTPIKGDPGPDPVNAKVPSWRLPPATGDGLEGRSLEHRALSRIRNRFQALSDVMEETVCFGYKISDDFADQVELLRVTANQFRDVTWHGYRNSTQGVKELAAHLACDSEMLHFKVSRYRAGYTHKGHSDFSLF